MILATYVIVEVISHAVANEYSTILNPESVRPQRYIVLPSGLKSIPVQYVKFIPLKFIILIFATVAVFTSQAVDKSYE